MKSFKDNVLFTALIVLLILLLPLICLANKFSTDLPEINSEEGAIQLFEQGREAFEMGRTRDAILYFNKALQKDEQYAVAALYKAMSSESEIERKTNLNKAVRFRNNATEGERILIEIELTYADNNSEKRFQLAKQLAGLYPESARAMLVLAGEYQAQGNISKFRDLASEAIRVEPESPLGYRALAASWLLNEPTDFLLAAKYMKKFVELKPNEASAHIAMGDVHRAFLKLDHAKIAYSNAIELEPESAAAFSKRGYIHTYLGMFDEARADFKKASALANHGQDYSKPNFSINSYLSPGNGKGTTPAVEFTGIKQGKNKRMPLNADTDNCYFCCTVISMSYGVYASPDNSMNACQCLQYEFEIESRTPNENTVEANIAFKDGFRAIQDEDYEKAKLIIEEYAHTISPEMKSKNNEAHNFLEGLIYSRQEKYHKALASFNKSDVNNIFVKYNLGLVYNKLEMFEEAKKVLTQVADFKFANARETQMAKTAIIWMKSYEDALMAGK
ncbi:MAG: hypothetical protein PHN68_04690 [Prolixibacteraceae bacterium]|nr:hypothetical protein [Prolixibacteraceae bacterium]